MKLTVKKKWISTKRIDKLEKIVEKQKIEKKNQKGKEIP